MNNIDGIMSIATAIVLFVIFLWGQYGINKASKHD